MMGWGSRANPRTLDGKDERDALNARIDRMFTFFATRADYEHYLKNAKVTAEEWAYLEERLPDRLRLVTQ